MNSGDPADEALRAEIARLSSPEYLAQQAVEGHAVLRGYVNGLLARIVELESLCARLANVKVTSVPFWYN